MELDRFSGTGRTTRMLLYAIEQAESGKHVVAYFNSLEQIRDLVRTVARWSGASPSGHYPVFEIGSGNLMLAPIMLDFDWNAMRRRGLGDGAADPVILVDHYVIESRFQALVSMLYRFIEKS